MRSQVGLRKHHYEQSQWRWRNSSWAISNPERWCCKSAALNMPANLESSAVAIGLEKVSFHSNPKQCSNYCTITLISHASKVMLKILQAKKKKKFSKPGFSNRWTVNFQMFNMDSEKAEEPEIKLLTSSRSSKKQEKTRNIYIFLLYWLCQSLWLCVSQ